MRLLLIVSLVIAVPITWVFWPKYRLVDEIPTGWHGVYYYIKDNNQFEWSEDDGPHTLNIYREHIELFGDKYIARLVKVSKSRPYILKIYDKNGFGCMIFESRYSGLLVFDRLSEQVYPDGSSTEFAEDTFHFSRHKTNG